MKIKQTIIAIALSVGFSSSIISPFALAATCGGVNTSIISCKEQKGGSCADGTAPLNGKCESGAKYTPPTTEDSGIWGILLLIINILTAGVGVLAVGGIVYGSMLYTTAGGAPDKVANAKTIIKNTVIGLVAFAFMYSLLNYLIPGGLFT